MADADGSPIQAQAERLRVVRHPTHLARHFELRIADFGFGIVKAQLNGGRLADDAARLAEITADVLAARTEAPDPNLELRTPNSELGA